MITPIEPTPEEKAMLKGSIFDYDDPPLLPKNTELSEPYLSIVKEKSPDQFIDLLCANNFFAGNLNGVMPVHENRIAFEQWLAARDTKMLEHVIGDTMNIRNFTTNSKEYFMAVGYNDSKDHMKKRAKQWLGGSK